MESSTPVALMSLPDDDLLGVLDCLDTPDLLTCRAVCRRLRDLAARPELWRRRSIQLDPSTRPFEAAVLRVAPCALAMHVSVYRDDIPLELVVLAATTRCAVVELDISGWDTATQAWAALVIRNQAALGRLRRLGVGMHVGDCVSAGLLQLLAVVCSTEGLTSLTVSSSQTFPSELALPAALGPASIEELYLECEDPRFVLPLLRAHAATLQAVALESCFHDVAPLLAAMPRLRYLQCFDMNDMHLLAGCPLLRSVTLYVNTFKPKAFLRAATQLVDLELLYYGSEEAEPGLLTALASSGRAALRKLRVDFGMNIDLMTLMEVIILEEELAEALPRLPALEWLLLHYPSRRLLDAIHPDRVPRLRGLSFDNLGEDRTCGHAVIHEPAVQRLLARYSSFYLVIPAWSCMSERPCDYCSRGCHEAPWTFLDFEVGFYTGAMPSRDVLEGLSPSGPLWFGVRNDDKLKCYKWIKA